MGLGGEPASDVLAVLGFSRTARDVVEPPTAR